MDKVDYTAVTIGGKTFNTAKLHSFIALNSEVQALTERVAALEAKLAAAEKEGAAVAGRLAARMDELEAQMKLVKTSAMDVPLAAKLAAKPYVDTELVAVKLTRAQWSSILMGVAMVSRQIEEEVRRQLG